MLLGVVVIEKIGDIFLRLWDANVGAKEDLLV